MERPETSAESGPWPQRQRTGHGTRFTAEVVRKPSSPSAPSGVRTLGDKAENRTTAQIDNTSTLAPVNSANQLTSLSVGGALTFEGSTSEAATVTVGGQPAATTATNEFVGKVAVTGGTQNVTVTAVDPGGATRTNTYSVATTGTGKTFTYDDNGNILSDGTRVYDRPRRSHNQASRTPRSPECHARSFSKAASRCLERYGDD